MARNMFETVMGALVLAVAGGFMAFAYEGSNLRPIEGYALKAKFNTVAGIGLGSDVRIGGIKVGVVSDMALDPATYQAILTLQMKQGIKLPDDSSAAVVTDGLLGSKYIKVEPGAEEKMLAAGETITLTQSAVNLEELIGKMAFGGVSGGDKKPAGEKAPDAAPPRPATVKP